MSATVAVPEQHAGFVSFLERYRPGREDDSIGLIDYAMRMNPRYQPSRVHHYLADKLEAVGRGEITRLIISYPPRHGKTELASINFPGWMLGTHPEWNIIACSYAAHLANKNSRRARNQLRDGRYPFPVRLAGDRAAVQQWVTSGGGEYNAAGVGGPITGMGANVLIIDDYVKNLQEADSPERRELVWDWYRDVAYPRLQENGAVIVIGTRWHEDDLIGRLIRAESDGGDVWDKVILKAIAEDDDPLGRTIGEPLWPERYGLDELAKRKAVMSSRQFRAQYQSSPVEDEGGMYKRGWWRFWHPPGIPLPPVAFRLGDGRTIYCPTVERPPIFDEQYQSWDANFGDTTDGSFVAGLVAGRVQQQVYLLDSYHNRSDFVQTCRAIRAMTALHPLTTRKWVENKANGPAIINAMQIEIPGILPVEPHGNKIARAHATTGFVEAGNVFLPHPDIAPWVNRFIDELAAFPASPNDDEVDAFSQLLSGIYLNLGAGGTVESHQYVQWGDVELDPWAAPGEPGYIAR